MDTTTALRVVARYQKQAYDSDKLIGQNARLTWSRHEWLLEELPQKGKKKLRRCSWDNLDGRGWQERAWNRLIPFNILRDAGVKKSDDYDDIKKKLSEALTQAATKITEELSAERDMKSNWVVDSVKGHEEQVHYLKVTPEGTDPFTAEGKDFKVEVSWTSFKAYDPDADFHNHDPTYTMYEASSAAAGRKLYQILNGDPKALNNVAWTQFSNWLNKNKVGYRTHFSQYR